MKLKLINVYFLPVASIDEITVECVDVAVGAAFFISLVLIT